MAAPLGEMGSLDEALSAMLASDHGQYSSLASVMTSSNSPCAGAADLFASQTAYSSTLHVKPGGHNAESSTTYVSEQWPFPMVDAKREAAVSGLGHAAAPLQRYHSAPSSFLQCLADFNVEAFSQLPESPLGDVVGEATLLNSFLGENLAPIHETRGSQAMDTANSPDASRSFNEFDRLLLAQNNSYISPTRQDHGHSGVHSTLDSLGVRSRPARSKILRQSSSPADFLAAVHDHLEESKPSIFQMPSYLSPDENMTSPNPEDHNAAGKLGAHCSSSRGRETDFTGRIGDSSSGPKLGELIRHSSLPVPSRKFSPPRGDSLDDALGEFAAAQYKTRAGRGFATHPRSIAERVRRTKISERMKKLQDLVPNMDRQTNTADMLDEAVEYVKQLQLQVQELSDTVVQLKQSMVHCTT